LAQAGDAFNQRVLVAQDHDERIADGIFLTDDHFGDFGGNAMDGGLKLVESQWTPFRMFSIRRMASRGRPAESRRIVSACATRPGVTSRRCDASHSRQHAAASSLGGM